MTVMYCSSCPQGPYILSRDTRRGDAMYRVRYAVLAEGDEVPPLAQWRDAVVGGIDAARRLGGTDATSLATFDGDEEVALTGSSAEEVFFQFMFACERRGSTPGLLLRVPWCSGLLLHLSECPLCLERIKAGKPEDTKKTIEKKIESFKQSRDKRNKERKTAAAAAAAAEAQARAEVHQAKKAGMRGQQGLLSRMWK